MPISNQTSHLGHAYLHDDLETGNVKDLHPTTAQEAATAAQDYVDLVRQELGDQDEVYRQFMDGLHAFLVDIPDKYRRMLHLLQGRPHLVAGFNMFLPDMYRNYDLTPEGCPRAAPPAAPRATFGPVSCAPPAVAAPPAPTKSLTAPHNMTTFSQCLDWLNASKPPSQPSAKAAPKGKLQFGATSPRASAKIRREYPATPTVPRAVPAKLSDFGSFTLPLTASTAAPSTSGHSLRKFGESSATPVASFASPSLKGAAVASPGAFQPQAASPQGTSDWLVSFNHSSSPLVQPTSVKTPEVTTPCYELNVPGASSAPSFGCHHAATKMHMPWTTAASAPSMASSATTPSALATTDSFVRMVHQRFHANPAKLSTFQTLLSQLQAHYCTQSHLLKQLYATFGSQANDDLLTQVATFLQHSCSHHRSQKQSAWPNHSTRCPHVMEGSDIVPLLPSTHAYYDQVVSTSLTKFFPRGSHDPTDAPQPSTPASSTIHEKPVNSSDERVVKLGFQDHFHRIRVRVNTFTLADLQGLFHTKVALTPGTFTIKYKDNDGDYVHVDTAADFHEAMQLAETMQRFRFDALPADVLPSLASSPEPEDLSGADSAIVEETVVVEEVEADEEEQDWRHAPEPEDVATVEQSSAESEPPLDVAAVALTPEQALKWAVQLAVVHEVVPSAKGDDVVRRLEAAKGNLQVVVNQLVDM